MTLLDFLATDPLYQTARSKGVRQGSLIRTRPEDGWGHLPTLTPSQMVQEARQRRIANRWWLIEQGLKLALVAVICGGALAIYAGWR